jgi:hypothetical protein
MYLTSCRETVPPSALSFACPSSTEALCLSHYISYEFKVESKEKYSSCERGSKLHWALTSTCPLHKKSTLWIGASRQSMAQTRIGIAAALSETAVPVVFGVPFAFTVDTVFDSLALLRRAVHELRLPTSILCTSAHRFQFSSFPGGATSHLAEGVRSTVLSRLKLIPEPSLSRCATMPRTKIVSRTTVPVSVGGSLSAVVCRR